MPKFPTLHMHSNKFTTVFIRIIPFICFHLALKPVKQARLCGELA